ncbi:iron chelate uptake ABC transporter family permease subunit, partial [Aerococcus urinae]|nr:iron chelate uptake ABC transporter family permease subunit [Aerococcus urinae]
LSGVIIGGFGSALVGILKFVADPETELAAIVFWQMGSIAGACWQQVTLVAPLCVIGTLIAFALSRQLDILSLGERAARHVGVNVERLRMIAMT